MRNLLIPDVPGCAPLQPSSSADLPRDCVVEEWIQYYLCHPLVVSYRLQGWRSRRGRSHRGQGGVTAFGPTEQSTWSCKHLEECGIFDLSASMTSVLLVNVPSVTPRISLVCSGILISPLSWNGCVGVTCLYMYLPQMLSTSLAHHMVCLSPLPHQAPQGSPLAYKET